MTEASHQFLKDLDKKLWTAADRLRANLDAAVYKHAVLGLIFLKYVSDSFATRQREIEAQLRDPKSDYYLDPADYGGTESPKYKEAIHQELEERDYYVEKNVFWVPALARWKTLQDSAKLPPGTEIEVTNGKKTTYKITSTGRLIDDALDAIEKENPKLKGVLDKRYTQLQLDPANLAGLIDLIATIPFEHADLHAKDILGHVYEYFLGQFALAEGKKGGQYFTPKSIVSLIVEMLEPYQGRVYDPAMGSGGFFVQSESRSEAETASRRLPEGRAQRGNFIEEHGGKLGNLSVYGQDKSGRRKRRFGLSKRARRASTRSRARQSNPTTWRLAAMNMAIRGIDFTALRMSAPSRCEAILQSVSEAKDHFGKEPANSFTSDQHPDLRADNDFVRLRYAPAVMANPRSNRCEWFDQKLHHQWRGRRRRHPPHASSGFNLSEDIVAIIGRVFARCRFRLPKQ